MGYRAYKEEEFIPGEYKMRCYLPDEDFLDFYFAGEGDYIQNCIYDLLNDFAAVSVSIKVVCRINEERKKAWINYLK